MMIVITYTHINTHMYVRTIYDMWHRLRNLQSQKPPVAKPRRPSATPSHTNIEHTLIHA